MIMLPAMIPEDLNIEELLSYMPEGSFRISVGGIHKRNAYNDVSGVDRIDGKRLTVKVGRRGLYDSLPEYMFHPVNRFESLRDHERFVEECERQETEKENAREFFSLLDNGIVELRKTVKVRVNESASGNKVMENLIGDELCDEEKSNRFIRKAIPYLPQCRRIRGNRTLLALMLRKIFMDEGLVLKSDSGHTRCIDREPRYDTEIGDGLGALFLGNEYDADILTYHIDYWPQNEDDFMKLVRETEGFCRFVEDYFLAVGENMHIRISDSLQPLCLADETHDNYLNYNTNL